ncbi:hypothetical protein D2L64_20450 [Micromonospora radicis]|uniref:XRE family transcriptional regulator n=1 Tax=Micromonospora radicis TaxID=1894971 RepID=A0A418MQY9_9ACTN|nr:hypothetical protein D2L64_20450 [Micromonospora radicis]
MRWENADTDPQPWHRNRIAAALGVALEQLDDMLVDVAVAAHRGQAVKDMERDPVSPAARPDLLAGLRTFLTSYLVDAAPAPSLVEVRRAVGRVHNLYQRASYTTAARLMPDVLAQATDLSRNAPGAHRSSVWTGFGPTNVVIHAVSAAMRGGHAEQAMEIGTRLDTARLPTVLVGRRAQVHVDLAAAAVMSSGDRSVAVLHLLEAERVAAEMRYANRQARELLLDLLAKERRAATPGLRPLAERAGLPARPTNEFSPWSSARRADP